MGAARAPEIGCPYPRAPRWLESKGRLREANAILEQIEAETAQGCALAPIDARTSLGLDEAMRRCDAYLAAGADVLFLESPESEQELEAIGKRFDAPLLVNVVEGGRTPQLTPAQLQQLGFSLAIYPASGFLAVAQALHKVYGELRARKGSVEHLDELYSFEKMCELMGFPAVWEFDREHAQ
jgi:2-methylisocitrate lyase-like PEP mutase family enzyme